jgi:purine-cytosine permease-like protein
MNRPTGVKVAAVLTICGAMVLALGSCAFFVVGMMVATGEDRSEPVSVAIAGMGVAGGFMLLILAGTAGLMAMNADELYEWARTISISASIATMGARIEERLRGVVSAARRSRAWFVEYVSGHKSRGIEHHFRS